MQLRRSETRVAEAVMRDPAASVHRTLAELAAEAAVSEPTVVRFCRAVGFRGFREFQITLAQALAAQGAFNDAAMTPIDPRQNLIGSVLSNHLRALAAVRDGLDTETTNRAIDILADARRIEFFGLGASGIVAADAQQKFFRLGRPTVAYTDPHMQLMSAVTLRSGDVVVAISHTGRTTDVLESVVAAKDAGAQVIAITSPDSPLSFAASVTLPVATIEDTDVYTPMMSRLAHLAVVDVLATGLALRGGPDVLENLRQLKRRLQLKRLPKRRVGGQAFPGSPGDKSSDSEPANGEESDQP